VQAVDTDQQNVAHAANARTVIIIIPILVTDSSVLAANGDCSALFDDGFAVPRIATTDHQQQTQGKTFSVCHGRRASEKKLHSSSSIAVRSARRCRTCDILMPRSALVVAFVTITTIEVARARWREILRQEKR